MLIRPFVDMRKADRIFARSALVDCNNRQFNISIRTEFGDGPKSTIDGGFATSYLFAIELPVVMHDKEILAAVIQHQNKTSQYAFRWFGGVRLAPRRHSWDEQELSFPTGSWFHMSVTTTEQAQRIAQHLFIMGFEKSPLHKELPNARNVFVYSLKN